MDAAHLAIDGIGTSQRPSMVIVTAPFSMSAEASLSGCGRSVQTERPLSSRHSCLNAATLDGRVSSALATRQRRELRVVGEDRVGQSAEVVSTTVLVRLPTDPFDVHLQQLPVHLDQRFAQCMLGAVEVVRPAVGHLGNDMGRAALVVAASRHVERIEHHPCGLGALGLAHLAHVQDGVTGGTRDAGCVPETNVRMAQSGQQADRGYAQAVPVQNRQPRLFGRPDRLGFIPVKDDGPDPFRRQRLDEVAHPLAGPLCPRHFTDRLRRPATHPGVERIPPGRSLAYQALQRTQARQMLFINPNEQHVVGSLLLQMGGPEMSSRIRVRPGR